MAFAAVLLASFSVLGWVGLRIYQQAPPVPEHVVTTEGRTLFGPGELQAGQNVWQSLGGMEVGSIWGHGSYVAPDWTADWLHRESLFILQAWAREDHGADYDTLPAPQQAALQRRLQELMRKNTYDPATGTLTLAPVRARAFEANLAYYSDVFGRGRDAYAMPAGTLSDPAQLRLLSGFFFWSSWAASTERPGDTISYTNNWPHEALVGNVPSGDTVVWTGVSIIVLLAGLGAMAFYYATRPKEELHGDVPAHDPLLSARATPSQRAVVKYFWVVSGLLLLQIILGVVTAHYGVEGGAFYGFPLAEYLPYVVTRTWHTQLGIFWIATAWLAAGLYIGPAVGGEEPRYQRAGVNVLFGALLVVVLGSMAGQWLSVMHKLGVGDLWFYFGHSGYEYIDLGRAFQIALLVGLFLWLFLVARAIWPALKRKDEQRTVLTLFLISSFAIAGFYGAALGAGRHTNLAVAEYWRWWVVHLWVEGFFEVFATVVIAFLFARLKLLSLRTAGEATVLSATIFLAGGVIGTLHHLYFSGTPTVVLALGSVFSALEVVPLLFVGYEAWHNYQLSHAKPWVRNYKWPIYFFISVAFWNLVGAGLFGFMINPPIALYYMQGLNTTPVHGHAALFGVYGMLGIGLMLFCLRAMDPRLVWKERLVRFAFWSINGGLMIMVVGSLLPVGLLQTWASVEHGYWYARSAEFLQTPLMNTLRWLRVPGDSLFALGAIALVLFVLQLGRARPVARAEQREGVVPAPSLEP
ncbi:nitric-oxide reductase large subunit [Simulacricoccus sp. 17bor-14]|nr:MULTISPECIES: nitric-oxide reductase large subunit [Myxococcaceae]MBF5045735.1 nitric-oxide reductase large subunit [Simulacricoccus sp. 17bor-14]